MSEGITIIRKVNIRSIVTEALKEELQAQVEHALKDLDVRVQALEKAKEAALSAADNDSGQNGDPRLMEGIKTELMRIESRRREILHKQKEYQALKLGDRFLQGTLDSLVDVNLGDILPDMLGNAEIVVNDGEIIEITNP